MTGLGVPGLHHLAYPRLLSEFGRLVFFTYPNLKEFEVELLTLSLYFSLINGFEWFQIGSLFKSFLLGPSLFLLYINDLADDLNKKIDIFADTTLCSTCDQASTLWQLQLGSDLKDTADWSRKWLVDLNTKKNQLLSFDSSINSRCYWCENGWVHL